jgi:predicted HTH transcriptional regulator
LRTHVLKLGYIDSWGRGTIKIIEACKEAGLPEPVLRRNKEVFLAKFLRVWRKYGENFGYNIHGSGCYNK